MAINTQSHLGISFILSKPKVAQSLPKEHCLKSVLLTFNHGDLLQSKTFTTPILQITFLFYKSLSMTYN